MDRRVKCIFNVSIYCIGTCFQYKNRNETWADIVVMYVQVMKKMKMRQVPSNPPKRRMIEKSRFKQKCIKNEKDYDCSKEKGDIYLVFIIDYLVWPVHREPRPDHASDPRR